MRVQQHCTEQTIKVYLKNATSSCSTCPYSLLPTRYYLKFKKSGATHGLARVNDLRRTFRSAANAKFHRRSQESELRSQEHRTGEAREDSRRNWCSTGSRGSISVARRSIGSRGRFNTGAGSASSLARSGAWFFPEGGKVIGEI